MHSFVEQPVILVLNSVRQLPDWFPGTGFKRTAREWANTLNEVVEAPYEYVKDQMVSSMNHLWAAVVDSS